MSFVLQLPHPTSLEWWRRTDGKHILDTAQVDDLVDFMFSTSSAVTLSRCSGAVTAFPMETAAVVCDYRAEGAPHSRSATASNSRLFATLVNGFIVGVTAEPDEPVPFAARATDPVAERPRG